MRTKRIAILVVIIIALAGFGYAADQEASMSVNEAIQFVGKPSSISLGGKGLNQSPFELQVYYRLTQLLRETNYKYEEEHAVPWKACMLDANQNIYARLCSAYFLLDKHEEARKFIKEQLSSTNLRHRYNAAKIVDLYVGRDSTKTWGIDLLIELLADGSLDGSGVDGSYDRDYPDGDRHDTSTPLDDICSGMGFMKEKKAVPALISVLERKPKTNGAVSALGDIGDKRAIPILMKILKDKSGFDYSEITALGNLKCKEAVPLLIARLDKYETELSNSGSDATAIILEALLEIGDSRAIPSIEEFVKKDFPERDKAIARRVLAQLKSPDTVKTLLELLEKETYEPEQSDIIDALVKFKDQRVVKKLATLARSSDSAFIRREAILGLRKIGDRESLLILASLLDNPIPKDLKAEWGWKGLPDFQKYFPETIEMCLKQRTKQDFGQDRAKWEDWLSKNIK